MRFLIWNKKDPINGIDAEHFINNLKIKENDEIILIIANGNKVSYVEKKDGLIEYLNLDINTTVEDVALAYIKHLEDINNNANKEQMTLEEATNKISNLSINNANLLKDSATKTIDITNLKKHNATILIDNANKTKQINNLNKNLATLTLELAKLKAQNK